MCSGFHTQPRESSTARVIQNVYRVRESVWILLRIRNFGAVQDLNLRRFPRRLCPRAEIPEPKAKDLYGKNPKAN